MDMFGNKKTPYGLIIIGNVEIDTMGLDEITEGDVNHVSGQGLIIATFETEYTKTDLDEFFYNLGHSFILFEIDEKNFSGYFAKDQFQKHLFDKYIQQGFIKKNRHVFDNQEEEEDLPELDDVLDKISKTGMKSLNEKELEILQNESKA